jgi:transcriptional regulator with PAS, ATPase and Fis domain
MNWEKEFPAAITVTNNENKIIYMNERSLQVFEKDGGSKLLGANLFECHSAPSNEIIEEIISSKKTNVYTIEKNGIKKLIYQSPWYENGEYKGLVELSLEIPFNLPHFVRS